MIWHKTETRRQLGTFGMAFSWKSSQRMVWLAARDAKKSVIMLGLMGDSTVMPASINRNP